MTYRLMTQYGRIYSWLLGSWLYLFTFFASVGQPLTRSSWQTFREHPTTFRWVAPTVLVPFGLALSPDYPNSHFDRFCLRSELQDKIHFRTQVDDFLQYGPAMAWVGLSLAGVKGRSQSLDRVLIGEIAYGISSVVVLGLKRITNEFRPDGSNCLSFPSGPTANTFTGAALLDREFSEISSWIPVRAYAMATSTGILRMTNDKHWIWVALVGAGIGLLSTGVAYRVCPWLKRQLGIHKAVPC